MRTDCRGKVVGGCLKTPTNNLYPSQSRAWACGRYLAEVGGSNPVGDMGVCMYVVIVVCCQVEFNFMF